MKNQIIITGGAGFIGSNIVKALNELGEENIIVVDNLEDGKKILNLSGLKISDYIDKEDFLKRLHLFKKAKAIFHMGACPSTTNWDGKYLMKNNYEYSKVLLNFSQKNKIQFLYASSGSVYGKGDNGFREERECEMPINAYAYSKFQFDQYVRKTFKKNPNNTQILGLRYFNVYGYQESHKDPETSMAYKWYKNLTNKERPRLFKGSEKILRDFVFIEDLMKVLVFFYKNQRSGIFNCATGKVRSFNEVAEILIKSLKSKIKIDYFPFPESLKAQYQFYNCADLTNLRKAGYKENFIELEEGLSKYLEVLKDSEGYLRVDKNYFFNK